MTIRQEAQEKKLTFTLKQERVALHRIDSFISTFLLVDNQWLFLILKLLNENFSLKMVETRVSSEAGTSNICRLAGRKNSQDNRNTESTLCSTFANHSKLLT